ncbi:MAG: hypothetical protein UY12_C0002G0001, partial [Parcubacteria group bacterium GW2011_GWA2_47_8b]
RGAADELDSILTIADADKVFGVSMEKPSGKRETKMLLTR